MPNDERKQDSADPGPREPADGDAASAKPQQPNADADHEDAFEPDPPWDLSAGEHPDPIAAGADPIPPTAGEVEAELRAIERRAAWPKGAAADELARAAERCGASHVWWLGLLRSGKLPGPQPWHEPILTDDLKLDWINAGAAPRGVTDHALDIRFGQTMRELCPGAERVRAWRAVGARPWSFRLPPLEECRERFRQSTLTRARQKPGVVQGEPFLRALPKP